MLARAVIGRNLVLSLARTFSEGTSSPSHGASLPKSGSIPEVPGLSSAVVHPTSQPVGPGIDPKKTGAYKVPEYFCYDNMSYFEAEIEMSKFRLTQPSAVAKK